MIGRFWSVAKALECKRPLYRFMIHKVLEQFYILTLSREKHWSRHLQFKRHKIKDRSRHCLSYKKSQTEDWLKHMYDSTPEVTDVKYRHLTFRPAVIFFSPSLFCSGAVSSSSTPPAHPITSPLPSSHDHLCTVDWPQILIIKSSSNAPPDGVSAPVRLVSQIWCRRNRIKQSVAEFRSSGHAGGQLGKAAWVFTGLSTKNFISASEFMEWKHWR